MFSSRNHLERVRPGTSSRSRHGRLGPRRLSLEALEFRKLLSVSPLCCTGEGEPDAPPAIVDELDESPNAPPVALDDAYTMRGDQQLGSNLLANDSDPDGDALSALLLTLPGHGKLAMDAEGLFVYKPDRGFEGIDTFTYEVSDGQAASSPATVSINVSLASASSTPQANDDSYVTSEDVTLSVDAPGVLANDIDLDGDLLRASLATGPRHGTLVMGDKGSFDYTPDADFHGSDSFTYVANDGQSDSAAATVTITVDPVNDVPVAGDDAFTTLEDQALSVPANGVLANDQDADGDSLSAVLLTEPANGTVTLNADGSFEYVPGEGFHGSDSFTYVANDGQSDSAAATVTITVDPVEQPLSKELEIDLETSATAFGTDAGPIWGGSTFWVSAYVQDLRELPLGVVGGTIDLQYDAERVTPTGNVVYGESFTDYRQGTTDEAAGLIDEAGALATQGGVGVGARAPFIAWEFRRSGPGAPDDPNSQVAFTADPGEGTGTITPANFALVGLGTPVAWDSVELDTVDLSLYLGDFNGNEAVNHFDLALWIPHAFSSLGDERFDPECDLDGDAEVNLADLTLLMPRLYRPVLNDAVLGSLAHGTDAGARPGLCGSTASARRLKLGGDSDWLDTVACGHRRSAMHSRLGERAFDSALRGMDSWRLG